MAMSTGGSGRAMSEINVTPMVDVMLVLLVIFMVTAPLIQQGIKVDLPAVKAPTMDVKEERVVLTLTRDQRIYMGKTEIPYKLLRDKLVGNVKLQKDKEIFLHADRALPYGFVVDIMSIIKEAGVDQMGMVTDPLSEKPH